VSKIVVSSCLHAGMRECPAAGKGVGWNLKGLVTFVVGGVVCRHTRLQVVVNIRTDSAQTHNSPATISWCVSGPQVITGG
jgi:hypothetical protein